MQFSDKIYVAGHNGLFGGTLYRRLKELGYTNIITRDSTQLDLRNQQAVKEFFETEQPKYVFLAAAKVGGIYANNAYPATFIYDNLLIQSNVIHESYKANVEKLLYLGSSCIYPKLSRQPIKEEYLLTGELEKTNEAYAVAKIAGIIQCQSYHRQYGCRFISAMPTNLYGPGDNYDLQNAHVLPSLLRKFYEAKLNKLDQVVIWGTGTPRREFMHVSDAVNAALFLMNHYESPEIINIGWGDDISIAELGGLIKSITAFEGEIVFDTNKPDGTPRKLLNVDKLHSLGWKAAIDLETGIRKTYDDFVSRYDYYSNKKHPAK